MFFKITEVNIINKQQIELHLLINDGINEKMLTKKLQLEDVNKFLYKLNSNLYHNIVNDKTFDNRLKKSGILDLVNKKIQIQDPQEITKELVKNPTFSETIFTTVNIKTSTIKTDTITISNSKLLVTTFLDDTFQIKINNIVYNVIDWGISETTTKKKYFFVCDKEIIVPIDPETNLPVTNIDVIFGLFITDDLPTMWNVFGKPKYNFKNNFYLISGDVDNYLYQVILLKEGNYKLHISADFKGNTTKDAVFICETDGIYKNIFTFGINDSLDKTYYFNIKNNGSLKLKLYTNSKIKLNNISLVKQFVI